MYSSSTKSSAVLKNFAQDSDAILKLDRLNKASKSTVNSQFALDNIVVEKNQMVNMLHDKGFLYSS